MLGWLLLKKIKCWIVVESRKEAMLVQRVGWVTDPEFYRA